MTTKKKTTKKRGRTRSFLRRRFRPAASLHLMTSAKASVNGEAGYVGLRFLAARDDAPEDSPDARDRVCVDVEAGNGVKLTAVLDLRTFEEAAAPMIVAPDACYFLRAR